MPAEKKNISTMQSFRNLIIGITLLSGGELSANQTEKIAISLYDYWLNHYNGSFPDFQDCQAVQALGEAKFEDKMKFLMASLTILDPSHKLSSLIFENSLDSEDDVHCKLSDLFPRNKMNDAKACIYRILVLAVFALGKTFRIAGNDKLCLNIFNLAVMMQERLSRTTFRISSDDATIIMIHSCISELALILERFEQSIEAGTKVVIRLDFRLSEVLNRDLLPGNFSLAEYYSALTVLADAAERGKDYSAAVFAYRKLVQFFQMEQNFRDKQSFLDFIDVSQNQSLSLQNTFGLSESTQSTNQKELLKVELCLKLINAIELSDGDKILALDTARLAIEHFKLINDSQDNKNAILSQLSFLLGRCLYRTALSLAGGLKFASSPPVTVFVDEKSPAIKELLEEALNVLENCIIPENSGNKSSDCQEAVLLQTAIIALEIRDESKAKSILQTLGIFEEDLVQLDQARKGIITTNAYSYFSKVIYSTKVFIRLKAAATDSSLSKLTSCLNLSSPNKQSPYPAKVQCNFCYVKCFNSNIKCEECAANSIFIWYCSLECKNYHLPNHICNQGAKVRTLFDYFEYKFS